MAGSIFFLLGCWLGCMVGFFLTGLMVAGRTDREETSRSRSPLVLEPNPFRDLALGFAEETNRSVLSTTTSSPLSQ